MLHWCCMFSQYLPSQDVWANGNPWVRPNLYWWSIMNHPGKPGWPSQQTKKGLHQVARCRTKGQCTQVAVLCHGNRVPRICTIPRWYQTATKKVQAILALMLPRNGKELHRFLGMVQYYRDIWARRSKMLAPLSNLVGECGHTKVTKANKTKKRLGIGIRSTSRHLIT